MKSAILLLTIVTMLSATAAKCHAQAGIYSNYGPDSVNNPGYSNQDFGNQNFSNQNYGNPNVGNQNYNNPNSGNQNFGNQNFGNQPYVNQNNANQSYGIAGRTANNSFNTGLSGVSKTTKSFTGPMPNHSRSTQAMLQLTKTLGRAGQAWSHVSVNMAPINQALVRPATSMQGILPPMSRKEMLRIFIDGGYPQLNNRTSSTGSTAPSGSDASYVYSNFRTAEKEANLAYDACDRAQYADEGSDKRYNASEAEYCASNAEYAAQCAESTAFLLGDPQSKDYAYRARDAANRARNSASKARYYADSDD